MFGLKLRARIAVLFCGIACLILSAAMPTAGSANVSSQNTNFRNIVSIVEAECKNYKYVPPEIILAIIAKESGFNPKSVHRTRSGVTYLGAMQINNRSAKTLLKHFYPRENVNINKLLDPKINIKLGVWHFNNILSKHGNNVAAALTAYNLGEGGYQRHAASRGIYINSYSRSVLQLAKRYKIRK